LLNRLRDIQDRLKLLKGSGKIDFREDFYRRMKEEDV
jgi:hypothetical protein